MRDDSPAVTQVGVLVTDPELRLRVAEAVRTAGYDPVVPRPLLAWVRERGRPVVVTDDVVATRAVRDSVTALAPEAAFVVLVDPAGRPRWRELFGDGSAVLPTSAAAEQLAVTVQAVHQALACLPATTARTVLAPPGAAWPPGAGPGLSEREVGWLRSLADGSTVAALARSAGWSQREMYRLLAETYARLGASTRTEALLAADRRGLLTVHPDATAAVR